MDKQRGNQRKESTESQTSICSSERAAPISDGCRRRSQSWDSEMGGLSGSLRRWKSLSDLRMEMDEAASPSPICQDSFKYPKVPHAVWRHYRQPRDMLSTATSVASSSSSLCSSIGESIPEFIEPPEVRSLREKVGQLWTYLTRRSETGYGSTEDVPSDMDKMSTHTGYDTMTLSQPESLASVETLTLSGHSSLEMTSDEGLGDGRKRRLSEKDSYEEPSTKRVKEDKDEEEEEDDGIQVLFGKRPRDKEESGSDEETPVCKKARE